MRTGDWGASGVVDMMVFVGYERYVGFENKRICRLYVRVCARFYSALYVYLNSFFPKNPKFPKCSICKKYL